MTWTNQYGYKYDREEAPRKAICNECEKWLSLYDSVMRTHICRDCDFILHGNEAKTRD